MKSKDLIKYYEDMLKIRFFEEKIEFLFSRGLIHGTAHLCIGQEGVSVGACAALEKNDLVTSNHRGHGHGLAKGLDEKKLMAELMGKATGFCKGKGGTQHFADIKKGFLGANGITGGGIPIATGAGLSIKMQRSKQVVLCFFGDGASNQGTFHESLNMASIWNLPVVYLCENNCYAMSTSFGNSCCVEDVAERASAYNIPSLIVDGNDVLAVKDAVEKGAKHARSGNGPFLIEAKTYRFKGHSKSDMRVYRTKDEEKEWQEKCPIKRLKEKIISKGILDERKLKRIEEDIKKKIEEAVEFAKRSPCLEEKNLFDDLFC